MAFFKFRWPGSQSAQQADEKVEKAEKPARRPRTPQAESVEEMRRRARHRLIGAALLVLLGVIGFPQLFDTQPRPIAVDIPIEIPDRNQVAPLAAPASAAQAPVASVDEPSAPVHPAASRSVTGLANGEEQLLPAPRPAASKPAPAVAAAPKPEAKNEPRPLRPDDSERVRALLEGRSVETAATVSAKDAKESRFIVQVGAFADTEKAREVRLKVERAGIKTYAQVVDTRGGKRTRVRAGPYASRAEADKAAARVKALDLPAAVLML
ncbi:SPOR domain-containing protein [Verminephrobacter aporrectodeae subsp. tuberculatae]|uniref:SPOR domain-containing protein n=1 Tax=Verminephrobacter aporrectodeae TaxID=1110389 RepID=UPI002237D1DC|nr:SPOR domain-containing protein [Verminephrobacter aporrectodeae]MCW5220491.1 SPOR domain-containing protein [Verminephrobacter aporrectodeae subsp. tuberculatae]MCW5255551.1 SPOR domain-containing protein [Verminephrobacter aporrectodeae subsp. tuberculatae]MCW5289787.1 SPOR domain-containing protein [Verminephrobacter aporrectodeae subsp. tuberculatae]MCW8199265.1 SPOR domain-containing protein [Verminephrobacter aporrectodeae subsp. tuberculatae]MCW8207664.1 SPOR domain-containing protein